MVDHHAQSKLQVRVATIFWTNPLVTFGSKLVKVRRELKLCVDGAYLFLTCFNTYIDGFRFCSLSVSRRQEFSILSRCFDFLVGTNSSKEHLHKGDDLQGPHFLAPPPRICPVLPPLRNSSSICVGRLCCCSVAPGDTFPCVRVLGAVDLADGMSVSMWFHLLPSPFSDVKSRNRH